MKIFLAGTSLRPAYGGPAYSVSRLGVALVEAGAEIGLWASDQSAADTALLPPQSSVRRLLGSAAEALDSFGAPDILHDNGIWLRHNHELAKLALRRSIPRIVSSRGMLEPWAMGHKRWKKLLAWWLYQRRDLIQAACLHTTAERESQNVSALGLDVPVSMIPNGVDLPEISPDPARSNRNGKKTALFLGRIYPVKGLPMLIGAWARVHPADWSLQIAGPDECGHQAELEKAVVAAGLSQVISFLGPLEGPRKQSVLFEFDLVVLPTHSESFGMVVAEALAHGLPVLTTTGAPWPVLQTRGCGWWVDASTDGITEGLQQATSLDRKTLRAMGARGRELVAAEFGWGHVAEQFMTIYEQLVAERVLAV